MATVRDFCNALRCPDCARRLMFDAAGRKATCECGTELTFENGLIHYTDAFRLRRVAEVGARDAQADGYLDHAKFPIQVFRVNEFLATLPAWVKNKPALELGCGPGPYTRILLEDGYDVIAVDFSEQSLLINRDANSAFLRRACYVKADLNGLRMASECSNLLLMCDFLQHLGNRDAREAFLGKAFHWLAPGGFFYLTFFNYNVVNRLKDDRRGHFAGGAIGYERLLCREVVSALPEDVTVTSILPLNIFHDVVPDRLAAMLPGAKLLSRMIAIAGHKGRVESEQTPHE